MRGRIMSIDMMSHGLMPLGVIPVSLIAERYSVAVALEVAGVTFVLVTVALMSLYMRDAGGEGSRAQPKNPAPRAGPGDRPRASAGRRVPSLTWWTQERSSPRRQRA